jgi:hypothetical protein
MTRPTMSLLIVSVLMLAVAGETNAAVVTGNFTGTITEIDADAGVYAPAISIGDPVVGTYTFDGSQAVKVSENPVSMSSVWEFPHAGFTMTVAVGEVIVPEHVWTVYGGQGTKGSLLVQSHISANPYGNVYLLRGNNTSNVFPNLPPAGDPRNTPTGYGSLHLRGYEGLVNNGGLHLPFLPEDINIDYATSLREGAIWAIADPYLPSYIPGRWSFEFEIDGHIVGVPGSEQYLPKLPENTVLNPLGHWHYPEVPGTGIWFDPPMVDAYTYQTDGNSNFTQVMLPVGIDADGQFTVTDPAGPITLSEGVLHTFSSPLSQFTVSGIDPAVDAEDPEAFPTYLVFDQPTVTFFQTPVPEPSTMMLAIAGIVGLMRRRRTRR